MIKTLKVKLLPNNKQQTRLFQFCGTKRFAYNWALSKQQENYKNGGNFISDSELRKQFTILKREEEYKWLNTISNNVTKQAIKDCCIAYKNFFHHKANFPKFKSKKKDTPSFYVDTDKIKFTDTHVKLEKLSLLTKKNKAKMNFVKLAEKDKIPTDCKYVNPHVVYDGVNWYICIGIEAEKELKPISRNEGVGIDLGIKYLAVCSDGNKYKNVNKTNRVKKLEKKKRRLQRSISRKYEMNKEGESYKKTSNIIKSEKELRKICIRLSNIRNDYLHKTTTEIIKREPSYIILENLNVRGMMKNRHLSKTVQEQKFYEFRKQIEYKASWNSIEVVFADRFYPSSKMCSCCGNINKDLKLKDRVYICSECGFIMDRDFNASLNIKNYYYQSTK